ncbi:MAG: poly-gamma-glutamate synthase PgsB [Deltaproteobacteria bacterium]|nr:poly-gamma-glutamate synthase PgsB [Deltaproteobacteria bacterium]
MVGFTILVLLALGVVELWLHRRRLRRIRLRIHVNGTRGKSSVTRLIAAGLRAGGIRTCAKTTGTLPRMIMPDGHEYPVFRPAGANILEQRRIVAAAVANECEALVVECMALRPRLQWLSEWKLIRATHAVITNARADHLDVMGPDELGVALALAGMIPVEGTLFTAERRLADVFQRCAADRKSACVTLTEQQVQSVTSEELARFPYIEHAENLALALAVCAAVGVPREQALEGMWAAQPDPGVMAHYEVQFFGRTIHFVNGFAANDPESTERVWRIALARYPEVTTRIAVFNCRADRPDRSLQLGSAYVGWPQADQVVLIGSGTYLFGRAAATEGLEVSRLVFADDHTVEQIFEDIVEVAGSSALVVGMGNIGGLGLPLVRHFRNRSVVEAAA